MIAIRWSTEQDAESLAALHRDAWRNAYAGIIPGLTLERMLASRGPGWWRRAHARGMHALLVEIGDLGADPTLEGYATLGRWRGGGGAGGEIYELYLRPEAQGIGLGRRLFEAARDELRRHGLTRLQVWALADNETACRFYAAMGGRPASRDRQRLGDRELPKVGFRWD
ncbi:MAG: GNAT family N-acetyltransferase [Amaricoccus sp.]